MNRHALSFVALAALASTACAADEDALRTRAAFDFQCPKNRLELQELDEGTMYGNGAVYGVTGCNRRGTYYYTDHHTWIMNTDADKSESR